MSSFYIILPTNKQMLMKT